MAERSTSSEQLDPREVESRIVAFIEGELLPPGSTIQPDDDLLSGEIIDSLGALRLADFVQEEFRFQLDPTEFVVENFQNVAVLTGFVCRTCTS
ncbi:MAG: acyl carrier protein [Acidobacteriota bacterium]|nr:acyl carrier protein [Acidobacteriota bacterium]